MNVRMYEIDFIEFAFFFLFYEYFCSNVRVYFQILFVPFSMDLSVGKAKLFYSYLLLRFGRRTYIYITTIVFI